MTCKHLNGSLIEIYRDAATWSIDGGIVSQEADHRSGDIEPKFYFRCRDCKMFKAFDRRRSLPQWLKSYFDKIWDNDDAPDTAPSGENGGEAP